MNAQPTLAKSRGVRQATQPRRGLSREEASIYIGVSVGKFDAMVADGRMPRAKVIDARRVWDSHKLDLAFDALPTDGEEAVNPWDG